LGKRVEERMVNVCCSMQCLKTGFGIKDIERALSILLKCEVVAWLDTEEYP
jgi:hypothetical protein